MSEKKEKLKAKKPTPPEPIRVKPGFWEAKKPLPPEPTRKVKPKKERRE